MGRSSWPRAAPFKALAALGSLIVLMSGAPGAARAAQPAATEPPLLAPLAAPDPARPGAPWRFEGLPDQTLPKTRFSMVESDAGRALRVESDASYGNLVHAFESPPPAAPVLSWTWRVDRPAAGVDLRERAADDTAIKVCAFYDPPQHSIPWFERLLLQAARAATGRDLPGATVCYVWDQTIRAGSILANVYTSRMRWIVLRSADTPLGSWVRERRDLAEDYRAAFEAPMPPLVGIAVGADTDNTGARALALIADLELR
ncbi:MAG: DUF3047 domain-containing protein [Burkholderiales bacterium]|nr:MAG: DUF3047 domain-containing protein [Burkholderiales bacterium]